MAPLFVDTFILASVEIIFRVDQKRKTCKARYARHASNNTNVPSTEYELPAAADVTERDNWGELLLHSQKMNHPCLTFRPRTTSVPSPARPRPTAQLVESLPSSLERIDGVLEGYEGNEWWVGA